MTTIKPATPLPTLPLELGPFAGDRGIFIVNEPTGRTIGLIDKQRDAEIIVTACNAYPELLAALRECAKFWEAGTPVYHQSIVAMDVRALLAKLGEVQS